MRPVPFAGFSPPSNLPRWWLPFGVQDAERRGSQTAPGRHSAGLSRVRAGISGPSLPNLSAEAGAAVGRALLQGSALPGAFQFPPSGGLELPFPGPEAGGWPLSQSPHPGVLSPPLLPWPIAFGVLLAFLRPPLLSLGLIVLSL